VHDARAAVAEIFECRGFERPPRSTPKLGYRGVELRLEDGVKFTAAEAVVTRLEQGRGEARLDSARSFESAVLATAPPGAIPGRL
jgi:hypothetical protein